ncbi:MAG TPA: nucleotide sugar dehydrogenase, partial [Gammaproteobacteria bacterium]|nr:nucleotide sugar dehydrogenase [Gammaproteobacteria bacterium]
FDVVGYDLKTERIAELKSGYDRTLEVSQEELKNTQVFYTDNAEELSRCRFIIVAVPTPIDQYRIPDLRPLHGASEIVGKHLVKGSCVVFESTVYPGTTEEECVPIMERESGLKFGTDFTVGYSPERINPGDKVHTVETIIKIVSGSDLATLDLLTGVYGSIVKAGLHRASSVKVAEAAKVIENTQRDLNIALMNELAMIFDKMKIDTMEVLEAAGTKWNFLPFRPGLVGGHCIGVDPYYLTFKAESLGYHPEMILAGRRINDGMGAYVAQRVIKLMNQRRIPVMDARVLVMGLTFKENCPDLRNTRVIDIVQEFRDYHAEVDVYDPWGDAQEARHEYGIEPVAQPALGAYDAIILAVAHRQFAEMGVANIRALGKPGAVLFDVKYLLPTADVDGRL